MGIETELRREIRMTQLRKAILSTIAGAGVLSVALLTPKVFSGFVQLRKQWGRKDERVRSAISRLKERGLIEDAGDGLRLTRAGHAMVATSLPRVMRPRKWDRKWRVVIFDIPNTRTRLRNILRDRLREIGFLRLQHSVWIFPFDCEELVALLRTEYHLGREVQYLIVDKIERDLPIRRHFDLTQ